ncbi:MAG: peptidylprolyl isomerase [Candidatus Sumerlaeota bacterium]|nr:peptidylprolyl isomerase [Candidatus Sumerlaeota bacterium]
MVLVKSSPRWGVILNILALSLAARLASGAYERLPSQLADRVVARVNTRAITLSEVEENVVRRRLADPEARSASPRKLYEDELRNLVDEELLYQAAGKMNIETPEAVLNDEIDQMLKGIEKGYGSKEAMLEALKENGLTLDKLKDSLRKREERQLKITRAISARFTISDADVDAYAKELRDEGKPAAAYHLRQILIRCAPDADAKTVEQARARAFEAALAAQRDMTFAEAATKFSEDEQTRADGGDLGYIDEGRLMSALEAAVKRLDDGGISQPVRSDSGFHVLQLVGTRTARKMLFVKRFEEEREKWLKELRRTETVETQMDFLKLLPE